MRKALIIIALFFITLPSLYAQIENVPEDSISVYLSQNWKEKARFLNRHQVEIFGDPIIYEFKSDNSFIKKIDNKDFKGSWHYDNQKKVIRLLIDDKPGFYVVALTKNELLLASDLHEDPNKGMGILVLLKPAN